MGLGDVKCLSVKLDAPDGGGGGGSGGRGGVFVAGQEVRGRVLLRLRRESRLGSLRVRARGLARVSWAEPELLGRRAAAPLALACREEATYLDVQQTLLAPPAGGSEDHVTLPAGLHEFPFCFVLPDGPLATSFEGRHGWVRYWVEAALERDWGRTQRTRHRFSVVEHVDINTPSLQESAAGAREKNVGFAMFGSSLIALSVKIDRRGYCPGEAIAIHAEVENCSSRLVVPKAALCQRQVFLAGGRTRSHVRAVAEVRGESVPSGRTDSWDGRLLKVPRLPPSVLSCALIRVEYCLQVYVDIPGSSNLQLELPLVLGTIPLQALGSRTSSVSSQRSVTGGPAWSELPEAPEAPPCYTDVVSEERFRSLCVPTEEAFAGPRSAYLYMQQFMLQPPPLYSEVDPHPLESLPVQAPGLARRPAAAAERGDVHFTFSFF
ncbi:unnamed protein product [Lampetra fluviatilis]